jgi:hypothetical protein
MQRHSPVKLSCDMQIDAGGRFVTAEAVQDQQLLIQRRINFCSSRRKPAICGGKCSSNNQIWKNDRKQIKLRSLRDFFASWPTVVSITTWCVALSWTCKLMKMSALYYTNRLSWIVIVLSHWNSSPWVDMSLHSETFSWFRTYQTFCILLNYAYLTEKQQIPIS